ncbi:hypothetical protein LCGC14_0329760 [marine sediment metagenome]|uniref:Uncharacterized protein n=1 Tax=marine sediment metagenome TaxID=412755 RepID=A0A0F9WNX2_9ZZZZ
MTRKEKDAYIAREKKESVLCFGCVECGRGKIEDERYLTPDDGFEQYWFDSVITPYEARRFVFKYSDPRESDVPVSQLSRSKTVTNCEIDEALARCVILCRSCADPRRTQKDDKCQKATSISD